MLAVGFDTFFRKTDLKLIQQIALHPNTFFHRNVKNRKKDACKFTLITSEEAM